MSTAALISDTHGILPVIPPEADFVIHAGDIGPDRFAMQWFGDVFRPWAVKVDRPIYATWGNHDRVGEQLRHGFPRFKNVRVLVDEAIDIEGVRTWFSPWSNRFFDWAWMLDDHELAVQYTDIPDDVRVIVSHGPPKNCCDKILWDGRIQNVGSEALFSRMGELQRLELVVTGHIHEARGVMVTNDVLVVNASCVDANYRPVANGPVLWPWPQPIIGLTNRRTSNEDKQRINSAQETEQ